MNIQIDQTMTTEQQIELAKKTFDLLIRELGPEFADAICHPPRDPSILPKGGRNLVRVRISPARGQKKPVPFWQCNSCYYEILVGPADGASNLGAVQFFRYADQKRNGGAEFTPKALAILHSAAQVAPAGTSDWVVPVEELKVRIKKLYRADQWKGVLFPCEAAASDLAWLIKTTMPKFQAISSV